jgi:hypothetical protein
MHDVREPTGKSGALHPSHMTARFRLGDAVEIPEWVLHSCHLCTMFPCVLLDIRTQVTSDLDPPLGHKSRQQLHPDLIDQSVKAVDAAVGTRFFHHLVKTPHESSLSQEITQICNLLEWCTPAVYRWFKGSAPTIRAPGLCWKQLVGAVACLAFSSRSCFHFEKY